MRDPDVGECPTREENTGPGRRPDMADVHRDPLHELARASMRDGRLPALRPDRILGGQGTGSSCDLCAQTLAAAEPELELEFAPQHDRGPWRIRLHVGCFAAWDRAREAL